MISVPPRSETLAHLHDDHRWHLVRRLLHDNDLPLEDRVAGLLLLLYAQPRVQLLLSAKPLDLPPPLDDLVRDLTARRHGRAVLG
ncbi:MAG: hypothetical protein ACRDSN_01360, partial [Pseudonocardiaceae bacterium]